VLLIPLVVLILLSLGSLFTWPSDSWLGLLSQRTIRVSRNYFGRLATSRPTLNHIKEVQRYSHVVQKLSGMSPTVAKERTNGNRCLPVRQVRVERLAT
jgi:hypothetical protein